jgi:hypothetical protein
MDIWRYVRHPDNSLALAHIYDEDVEIVVPLVPRPDPTARGLFLKQEAWNWTIRLTLIHFFALLGCAHFVIFPYISFFHLALSLGVGLSMNGEYAPIAFLMNYMFSWSVLSFALMFKELYSLIVSLTYIIIYSIDVLFFRI